jgi:3-oxoacyl-[acyl-carrier-protein] synthase-3
MSKKAHIHAIGVYLPEKVLSNQDLEKLVETTDEWIVSRTGMRERRIAHENEFTSDMGTIAAKRALEKAGLSVDKIDLILVATLSPDYPFPSTACLIQANLKAKKAASLDIQAACSGLIYGLSIAKAYIESGIYKNILLVAAEKLSSIIDYQDRNTCVLFGDGAAACVIGDAPNGLEIGTISLGSDGGESHLLMMPGGGARNPSSQETVEKRLHYLKMNGKEVFRQAVRHMESACLECIQKEGLKEEDIAYLVPHQANIRIIEAIAKRCKIAEERVIKVIHLYGNTSAASVGLGLHHLLENHPVKEEDRILLVAFGAGLTWGSVILRQTQGLLALERE